MNAIKTSIRVDLVDVDLKADALLHERLMRPQQAARRFAYNRLVEGVRGKTLWHSMREKFPTLTGRNVNDAITLADAVLASQRERLPAQIKNLTRRIKRTEKRLKRALDRQRGPKIERVQAMRRRLDRLTAKRDELQACVDHHTVPPALFGGRKLWRKVQRRLPGSREAWRARRTGQFYSRGSKNYKGNPHCRVTVGEDDVLWLSIRVPDGFIQRGNRVTTRALWLTFGIRYSRPYKALLRNAAVDGAAKKVSYDVRLLRLSPGQYRAYVTINEPVAHREYAVWEPIPAWCARVGGIDINLDHLAVVMADQQGQFRAWQNFRFPNLGELPRNKSLWQIGNIARDAILWIKSHGGQAIVIEDLNISHKGGSARFNRRTVPFAYRQLAQALVRRALREGLAVKLVNPAYTSWIGQLKYANQYGTGVHVAAAYVIARRGLELQERIPKKLLAKFPVIVERLQSSLEALERSVQNCTTDEEQRQKLSRQIEKRREWIRRLTDWKSCSPQAGQPWLLWVTLYLVSRHTSGVRDVLF